MYVYVHIYIYMYIIYFVIIESETQRRSHIWIKCTNNRHNEKLDFIVYGLSYKHSTFFRTLETSFHSILTYESAIYADISLHENHIYISNTGI